MKRALLPALLAAAMAGSAKAQTVVPVADINAGPPGSSPGHLTVCNDVLYFAANDSPRGTNVELWRFDGTTAEKVAEIRPGDEGSGPSDLVAHAGKLYFSARGDDGPRRLWQFDGVTASLAPGAETGAQTTGELTVYRNLLCFRAYRSGLGVELWTFDGVRQTPIDIFPGPGNSYPQHLVEYGDLLLFSANGLPGQGTELWSYDGLTVSPVTNIRPDSGSAPAYPVVFGEWLYFSANDGQHGNELWRTNGTHSEMVADIAGGGALDSGNPSSMTVYRDALYFSADNGVDGNELWRYDGARAEMIANINPRPFVPDIDPVHHSFPAQFFVFEDILYFTADDGTRGRELWRYDGTEPRLVADIHPGPYGSSVSGFAIYRGDLYFSADDGETGGELNVANFVMWKLLPAPPAPRFVRGDCNGDARTSDVTDPIFLLEYAFLGGQEPPCRAACDFDRNGDIGGVTDAVLHLEFNFLGGPPPAAPYPDCGPRLEDEPLDCRFSRVDCP